MKLSSIFGSSIKPISSKWDIEIIKYDPKEICIKAYHNGVHYGELRACYVNDKYVPTPHVWLEWIGSRSKGLGSELYAHFMKWATDNNYSHVKMDASYGSYLFHFKMGALPKTGMNSFGINLFRIGLYYIREAVSGNIENVSFEMEIKEIGIKKWKKIL